MINAVVTDTFFGIEDHGILCFTITFKDADGGYQATGQYYGEDGLEKLYQILTTIGVSEFNHLIGKPCRISRNEDGFINHIHHFIEDKGVDIR